MTDSPRKRILSEIRDNDSPHRVNTESGKFDKLNQIFKFFPVHSN